MTDNLEELERRGLTPLDNKLNHKLLDVFREGSAAFDSGTQSPYHGHSLEHCLHAAGWVQRDLRVALDKANAALIATAREVEGLRAEVARLRDVVKHYGDTLCEGIGECVGDFCGKLSADECSGCFARAALAGKGG